MTRAARRRVAAALVLLLGACTQPRPETTVAPGAAPLPAGFYADAEARGGQVYRIVPEESLVLVRVGRAGPLKRLGHDHVVASEDVEGFVLWGADASQSRADLALPLAKLLVDKPEYRVAAGLDAEVSDSAIADTTANMQGKVLESATWPWAQISVRFADALTDPPTLSTSITLHGTTSEYVVPVRIERTDERLTVAGTLTIQHSDFDLQPFSAAGGLLRVAEDVGLEFTLSARR